MNATSKQYAGAVGELQALDNLIAGIQRFAALLVAGDAKNIRFTLSVDRPKKEEKPEVLKDEDGYSIQSRLMNITFISAFGVQKDEAAASSPACPIDERIALQLCTMALANAHEERKRLLRLIGITMSAEHS